CEPYDYTGDITVTAGGTHPLGQVNLEYISGGTIDGTITAQDDQAVEEAMVKLDNSPYFALTDSNGEYQMDGIRIGTYTVTISHSLIETSVQETSVAISKTATAIVDKSLTDNAPPVWESTPGVLYAFDLDPETDDRLAVEFNRALDACPPVTYVLYYDLAESWDPDNWANNNPAELSSGDLYEGIKADYGYLLTGLTAGSRYIFGIRAKDRHDNIEYNTAEYISVPNDGTVTAAERENLLAAIGRVGIGTTNPSGLFHVQPLTGEAFVVSEADGYVGIGTSTPSEALTVGSDNFTVTMTGEVTAGDWKGSAIGLTYGGTGATDASGARTNLGLGGLATLNAVAGGAGGTITDASITDADINSAAGISGTKIDPDFGAQHVITTGTISVGTTLGITAETGMIRWDGTNFKG
ncbi:MAG: carboxypeptidase-like regulatory domain-containing protein, partial [bacterium]|nr:carboxypeptidase-like regulatory domain-containing protein [bacterium]